METFGLFSISQRFYKVANLMYMIKTMFGYKIDVYDTNDIWLQNLWIWFSHLYVQGFIYWIMAWSTQCFAHHISLHYKIKFYMPYVHFENYQQYFDRELLCTIILLSLDRCFEFTLE